ncbi:hypothetical protein MMM2322_00707 [Microbacterium sp. MM2322]
MTPTREPEAAVSRPDKSGGAFEGGWLTWTLLIGQIFLAVAAVALTPLQGLRSAVCDEQCDFATAEAALEGVSIAAFSILALTLVLLYVRRHRWSTSWPIPATGIILTVIAMIVSNQIFMAALPPLPA